MSFNKKVIKYYFKISQIFLAYRNFKNVAPRNMQIKAINNNNSFYV